MKVGFIGLGNMGAALAQALAKVEQVELLLSNHNTRKAEELKTQLGGYIFSNQEIAQKADVIFLGVKPHLLPSLLEELASDIAENKQAVWISMAAGVTLDQLEQFLPAERLIRMMPNTPVAIGQGMTTYALANPALAELFEHLMQASGQVRQLPEKLLDPATAIAGCGPAFVYQFIEAMTDAGVQQGLSAQDAKELAAQTMLGSAKMVLESDKHPAQLRQEVTSPGGATIAGVVALEKAGFRYAVIKAVSAALKQTWKLGKKK